MMRRRRQHSLGTQLQPDSSVSVLVVCATPAHSRFDDAESVGYPADQVTHTSSDLGRLAAQPSMMDMGADSVLK
jgi:hypothetical protein